MQAHLCVTAGTSRTASGGVCFAQPQSMATPSLDRHYADLFLEDRELLDSNANVVHHRVVVTPRPTAGAPLSDQEDEPCSAARGILIGLALCTPFWMGVYLLLF
jgi:hypothetical protein